MDGLKLRFSRNPLEGNFTFDEYGALIPSRDHLKMENVSRRVSRQLKADTGLYRRLTDMYYRTDVEFTDNPAGNTPTLGVGAKRYGKRPLNVKFGERVSNLRSRSASVSNQLKKREAKIVMDQRSYMELYKSCEPTDQSGTEYVQWLVEGDQVMTGGGFDNNSIGDVQKSALSFVVKGSTNVDFGSNQFSQLLVEAALNLKGEIEKCGLVPGSIKPLGCSAVRQEQDKDGMLGFPVYDKSLSPLTPEIATRLLIESGVDCRKLVGAEVVDKKTGVRVPSRVVDGIAYILDNSVINDPADWPSIVTLLARIQKHGWKEENGEIVPKKSKTRSVYPNAALPGMIEAMVFSPFNDKLQELKFPFMPSLQDKPTRVQMVKDLITRGRSQGYEFLSLDESAYDATVIGGALATIIYYAVRPFFNAQYYDWVDFATYCLVYKYIMCDTALSSINSDDFAEAKNVAKWVEVGPFTIFGLTNGLISGAKFTHVGGSLYGGCVIHQIMPKMMGFQPLIGVQAGDDCVWAYPKDRVDFSSAENTYKPVEETAKLVGIDINKSKQIWHVVNGELVNIFLQDVYHETTGTWGTGSIFRPLTSVLFSERNKGLSIAEQFMAEIARMNQGSDCIFAAVGVRRWLELEEFIGLLFKNYGVNAFKVIIDSIGQSVDDIAQRIDVGSFTFGVSREDLDNGTLPILSVIAEVASSMSFNSSMASALKALQMSSDEKANSDDMGVQLETLDIGDTDDVRAD